jgi:RimJ/RimL family protein N-acetyltransferase
LPILIDIPERLVGDRVVVRAYRPGDGIALNEAILASLDHLRPTMPFAQSAPTIEESEDVVRRFRAKWILREDIGMGIWNPQETRVLGGTGLHRIDWEARRFEIGYWIRPDEEGKGLVSESVRLLCELAFETLGANRVHIRCAADNLRSAAVPRRLGFVHEGTLRHALLSPSGEIKDELVFGMIRSEWEERKFDQNP